MFIQSIDVLPLNLDLISLGLCDFVNVLEKVVFLLDSLQIRWKE